MDMDTEPTKPPRLIGFAATWAFLITISCVLVGQSAEQFAASLTPPSATLAAAGAAHSNGVDFTPIGAVKGQTITINPCTGKQVGP
jgi:uncharacterized membrane protein YecN with MAPEG domain